MKCSTLAAYVGAVLALSSCRSVDAPAPAPAASITTAPAANISPPPRPEPVAETRSGGLYVRSGGIASKPSWGFSDLGLDLSKIRLEIVAPGRGEQLQKLLPAGALAVVNGGYFEADFRPSTWLKSAGVELSKKSDTSKGGLLAVGAAGVYLGPFSGLGFEPELAVQSFPLIVEADGSAGIHRDDGRRAARTVVCWSGDALHFIVIAAPRGEGPTLFESVALLRAPWPAGFGCHSALNLDGGPSSGVWFNPELGAKQRPPFAPVAYGIALLPR
jgi:hypothetical protein